MTKMMTVLNNLLLIVIIGMLSSSSTIRLVSSEEVCKAEMDEYETCFAPSCAKTCTASAILDGLAPVNGSIMEPTGFCSLQSATACTMTKCCSKCASSIDSYFTCIYDDRYPSGPSCSISCDTSNIPASDDSSSETGGAMTSGGASTTTYPTSSFTFISGIIFIATAVCITIGDFF